MIAAVSGLPEAIPCSMQVVIRFRLFGAKRVSRTLATAHSQAAHRGIRCFFRYRASIRTEPRMSFGFSAIRMGPRTGPAVRACPN